VVPNRRCGVKIKSREKACSVYLSWFQSHPAVPTFLKAMPSSPCVKRPIEVSDGYEKSQIAGVTETFIAEVV
jgi:hypothetical protein